MADTSEKREETASDPAPSTPETPAAPAAEPVSQATETPAGPEGTPLAADATPHRKRRRRRRRRRHGPRPPGEQPAAGTAPAPFTAGTVSDEAGAPPSSEAPLPSVEGAAAPELGAASEAAPGAPSATPAGEQPRRRRRRRRRRKPPPGAETGSPGATPEGAAAAATGEQAAATDARPPRKPWRGRPRWRQREGESENRDQRARDGGARTEGTRGGGGPRGDREHAKRDRDRRDKRHGRPGKPGFGRGRDRDGHGKKPEQKLYASESIVDHGFEDVAPTEEGGEARRVDWSIVKRMMVDQRSTRSISTVYVLKRDGAETEFPYLAAAREAVNKKIVHPEKLTKPKEDYAALYTKK